MNSLTFSYLKPGPFGAALWFAIGKSNAAAASPNDALRNAVSAAVDREYASLDTLYKHLHTHPELSFQEKETAARMARELRQAGFEVTEGVGGFSLSGQQRRFVFQI